MGDIWTTPTYLILFWKWQLYAPSKRRSLAATQRDGTSQNATLLCYNFKNNASGSDVVKTRNSTVQHKSATDYSKQKNTRDAKTVQQWGGEGGREEHQVSRNTANMVWQISIIVLFLCNTKWWRVNQRRHNY
jgi:hypothetical protein